MIKRKIITYWLSLFTLTAYGQEEQWGRKFEQLDELLPTPNIYRTGSGAPGEKYWQQKADYVIDVELDDENQRIIGKESIIYHNQSPHSLPYLWVQLDQNVRAKGNLNDITGTGTLRDSLPAKFVASNLDLINYEGGFKINSVKDASGKNLTAVVNRTMMRIDLPTPLKPGENFTLNIEWSYNVYDRMTENGRGGYEYFPEDGNYSYTIAQWFPRMAVYDDYEGWQNKQFIGRGEFALTFGDYVVNITVPSDHIVTATGWLQNPQQVLNKTQLSRWENAQKTYDKPVFIVTEEEARANEQTRAKSKKTWTFKAENVRDFSFASSRKFIWDAMAVKLSSSTPMAMSLYPKEGNPLWEKESTKAVKNTLEVYSDRTFDYPYPVAISVHAANQGMEYPMICYNYGRPARDGTYSARLRDGMISVIVHEVGHNYFPMIVNSDERQWTWMDEGLNTFLEKETKRLRYPDLDLIWGTPRGVVPYMKGDKSFIRPIMTNSEQVLQFGYNAYGKPSAALTVLREVVMGPDLFDNSFKEYAQRWMFKHPKPADFFRTMEDASAVDLDWFWRGWFYSVDHVDVSVDNVKWFRIKEESASVENKRRRTRRRDLSAKESENSGNLDEGPQEITVTDTDDRYYGEYMNKIDDSAVRNRLQGKNIYEIKFTNQGGLVTPLVMHFIFKDGTEEKEVIPAEIWRYNEKEVSKTFVFEKELEGVVFDREQQTGDTNPENNVFPRTEGSSRFDQFNSN